jgi:hypothetical protein
VAIIPRLHDGGNVVRYESSGEGLVCAGPTKAQAEAHLVGGAMEKSGATLELKSPRGEAATHIYAASWDQSGAPPAPVKYRIEYSIDGGGSWKPVVKDWVVERRSPEPKDFWSQRFCWGDVALAERPTGPVRVRFANDGGKGYRKVEAQLGYDVKPAGTVEVEFAWKAGGEAKRASHACGAAAEEWTIDAGKGVETEWVEYRVR